MIDLDDEDYDLYLDDVMKKYWRKLVIKRIFPEEENISDIK